MSCFPFNLRLFDIRGGRKGTSEENARDAGKGRADFEDKISQSWEQALEYGGWELPLPLKRKKDIHSVISEKVDRLNIGSGI